MSLLNQRLQLDKNYRWEWVTTDRYDANNAEHQRVRFNLEKGNGLPETVSWHEVIASLKRCGFEVIEYFDGCEQGELPWWNSVNAGWGLRGFSRTWFGIRFTGALLWTLEKLGIVSQGMYEAQNNLQCGADMLVQGGKMGICKFCVNCITGLSALQKLKWEG